MRASILYFCIKELSKIEYVYQTSLSTFLQYMVNTITSNRISGEQRLQELKREVTRVIYVKVSRGLFSDHQTVFAFMLATRIQRASGLISAEEWDLFTKGAHAGKELESS